MCKKDKYIAYWPGKAFTFKINGEGLMDRKASAIKNLFIENNSIILDDFPTIISIIVFI
jgi:hypothetical protein